ncbi:hypothetical protein QCN29_02305 [Streptomyces sp. HNM0663]|uniref:Uncharacterized protein n=1 Tax=Streptomyces chengmaiensis TaxID=3040919 RepID=A0ABT6HG31_9ACTN|nr:hypothetical protein [Streptomyces chengmaiensis]MDH2387638.1 hypothetical protein [Streptomyces chengmaiensis]
MASIPLDLLDRIRALERDVRTILGRANIRPALDEITHGKVKIAEGGTLEVYAPDGTGLFGVGQFGPAYNHTDGSPQQGVHIQREDGTTAFTVRAIPQALGVDDQAVSIWDRSGHQVLSDETTTGWGLGTPYLPLPFQALSGDDVVTSSSFVNRYFASVPAQQPVAAVLVEYGAAAGATCEVRVQYRTADETGWTDVATAQITAPANTVAWDSRWLTFPLHRSAYLLQCFFRVQVRQKAGSNGASVHVLGAHTRATRSTSETPDPRPSTRTAERSSATPTGPGHGTAPTPASRPPHGEQDGLAFVQPTTVLTAAAPIRGLHGIDD